MNTAPKFLFVLTAVTALSFAHPASANLITNPGFETGDFTGWPINFSWDVRGTNLGIPPHFWKLSSGKPLRWGPCADARYDSGPILHDQLLGGHSYGWVVERLLGRLNRFPPCFSRGNWLHRVYVYRDRLERLYANTFRCIYSEFIAGRHQRGTGGCGRARWRLNSFSARLRFTRLGCRAAQTELLSPTL
jgi:hypothetical protein